MPPHCTVFQVLVGKGAAFEGREGLRYPEDFPDGTSRTLLVVEGGPPVPWNKPEDIPYAADRPLPEFCTGMTSTTFTPRSASDGSASRADANVP